jgi:general secretion pathway protein I
MRRQAHESGFSLLEVMVALAILGMALVVLVGITTDNVRATHHAKMVSVATFLARAKMADLEDQILDEGFVDNDQDEEGDFAAEGQPDFSWKTLIEKVELPTDLAQQAEQEAQDVTMNADNPLMAMAGFMGGLMSTLIEPIRVGLEESVRRVSVRVSWQEPGRPEQAFEVVTFMTDPARLDMALQGVGQVPGDATGGLPGAAGQGQGAPPGGGQ